MKKILKITNIEKSFNIGTINEKLALANLNLQIREGEFVTIIGGNGSGKSTLLNIICGVYKPDTGSVKLDGVDITVMPEHKRAKYLGRVFQDPMMGTAANMSIQENLAFAFRRTKKRTLRWGYTKKERDLYVERLKMLDLGLEERLTTKVGLLSGGQRQAVTLLMATLQKPRLLLLDEHTAALDPKTAAKVLSLTRTIVERDNLTTLMVTHNMRDAIKMGSRLIMMHDGRVIYDVEGEEKSKLTVEDLLHKFESVSDGNIADDRMLLS